MADLKRWSEKPRSVAAAVVLQLYGGIDPDQSRTLADRVVRAVDRTAMRGHTDAAPTDDEVDRAMSALTARGVTGLTREIVREALDASFVRGWGQ